MFFKCTEMRFDYQQHRYYFLKKIQCTSLHLSLIRLDHLFPAQENVFDAILFSKRAYVA